MLFPSYMPPSVLFLTRWYPPHSGHFIRQMAEAVSAYARVTVLTVEPVDMDVGRHNRYEFTHETAAGIPTLRVRYRHYNHKLPGTGAVNTLSYLAAQVRGYGWLRRNGFAFDIRHVHVLTRTALLPMILKVFTHKPYLISEYWTRYIPEAGGYDGWLRRRVTRLVIKHAAAVTAPSGFLQKSMEDRGLRHPRFTVLPMAVDTRLFSPGLPVELRTKKRIIHISNFSDRAKNVSGILRVLQRLSLIRNDFECLFIGGAEPHTAETVGMARRLGLYDSTVRFTGPLFGEALAQAVREADFLVMFSNYETFSMVIQECLAAGKPVVAAAAGPVAQLVGPESGLLVPPGDEEALLAALNRMLDVFPGYDPDMLRDSVERRFGYDTVGRALGAIYGSP